MLYVVESQVLLVPSDCEPSEDHLGTFISCCNFGHAGENFESLRVSRLSKIYNAFRLNRNSPLNKFRGL